MKSKPTVYASSNELGERGITKLVREFYCSKEVSLHPTGVEGEWEARHASGRVIEGTRVRLRKGRYYLEKMQ